MHGVRLIREVSAPTGRGPGNGQFALQRALRARAPAWLRVGGTLEAGEIPWFWCWLDRDAALACAAAGHPFVAGPNMLFEDSRRPCRNAAERELCNAASCRLWFTESAWYQTLLESHRGPANRGPIAIWPYPIDPQPGGPLPAAYDVLLYEKSGLDERCTAALTARWPRHVRLRYGRYRRARLYDAARRARCCVYFSDDDRGPLALAEILLSGCPVVGIPRGAPFATHGTTGVLLPGFSHDGILAAVERCHQFDRTAIATAAARQFDSARIVDRIVASLRKVLV
jgi:hypothetical protein